MERLSDFSVVWSQPLAWGDMDAFGHVNNVRYFAYFENARIAYFDEARVIEEGASVGPILASTQCKFKLPLTFPDTLHVGARVTNVDKDRFTMEYAVFSEKHQRVAALGEGVIVAFDYKKQSKSEIPAAWLEHIQRLDGPKLV